MMGVEPPLSPGLTSIAQKLPEESFSLRDKCVSFMH